VLDKATIVVVSIDTDGVITLVLVVSCRDERTVLSRLTGLVVVVTELVVVSASTEELTLYAMVLLGMNPDVRSLLDNIINLDDDSVG
jgi:hypothetical protein